MASLSAETIPAAPPPWQLKGTIYGFMVYATSKGAEILSSDKSFLYSPLEAGSSFSDGKFVGGLGMVQVVRYTESPVGPYDELLMVPGEFEYMAQTEAKDNKTKLARKKNLRLSRIYVSQKLTCWNGRISKTIFHFISSLYEISQGH